MPQIFIYFIRKEIIFFIFFILFIILQLFSPAPSADYFKFVDWRTITALAGLIIITSGFKESGYFEWFASNVLLRFHSERLIALFFVLFSAVLSAFLTNDITLFIIVPLTLSLQGIIKNDIERLIFFEAIAVNVGSALTPIGNPQNLYLWHQWNISFFQFIQKMGPLSGLLFIMLAIFTVLEFKAVKLEVKEDHVPKLDKRIFFLSLAALPAFILSLELKLELPALIIILAAFSFYYKKVLKHIDWILLLLFILMFLDFNLLSRLGCIQDLVHKFNIEKPSNNFLFSAFSSQITSNVPASILMTQFSDNYRAIAYGVNIAGQGTLIGSLANLIALRLLGKGKAYLTFHIYSIPFFIISTAVAYFLFFN